MSGTVKNDYQTLFDINTERLLDRLGESDTAQLLYDFKVMIHETANNDFIKIEDAIRLSSMMEELIDRLETLLRTKVLSPEEKEIIKKALSELKELNKILPEKTAASIKELADTYKLQQENNLIDGIIERYDIFNDFERPGNDEPELEDEYEYEM